MEQKTDQSPLEFIQSKNSSWTIRANGKFLYSQYDPKSSIQKEYDTLIFPSDSVILLGAGLGLLLQLLENDGRIKKIFLIETDIAFYEKMKKLTGFSHSTKTLLITERKNLSLLTDFDLIHSERPFLLREKSFACTNQCVSEKEIQDLLDEKTVELLTNYRFGMLWFDNLIHRIKNSTHSVSSTILQNLIKENQSKLLLIGAGPSLVENIGKVKDCSSSMIVACADTAYPYLQKQGIIPDIVFSIDAQNISAMHFQNTKISKTTLFVLDTLCPESLVRKIPPKQTVFIRSLNPLNTNMLQQIPVMTEGLSVMNVALEALWKFGAKKIIFAGIDLSYPSHAPYSGGNHLSLYFCSRNTRTKPLENFYAQYMKQRRFVTDKDFERKPVRTTPIMQQYRNAMERFLSAAPSLTVSTMNASGLVIKGVSIGKDLIKTDHKKKQPNYENLAGEHITMDAVVLKDKESLSLPVSSLLYRWKKRGHKPDMDLEKKALDLVWKKATHQ